MAHRIAPENGHPVDAWQVPPESAGETEIATHARDFGGLPRPYLDIRPSIRGQHAIEVGKDSADRR